MPDIDHKKKRAKVGAAPDAEAKDKPAKKRSTSSTVFWGGLLLYGLSKLGKK